MIGSLWGCSQVRDEDILADEIVADEAVSEDKLTVAVSIVPQEAFVKAVAGDLVEVVTMVPPGSSPANYEPAPKEMEGLSKSQIYFSIGVPTEQANILPGLKDLNEDIKIVSLAEEAAKIHPDRELAPGKRDPHIWLSPKRAKVMVETIYNELAALDHENQDIYQQNAREYLAQLDELDQKLKESADNLTSKAFIVYHPAFGYFADDYGLTMIALEEDGKEATAQRLQEVIDMAKEENIKVIFYQKEIDSKQSEALAEELGGRTEQVAPLSPDYIGNLEKFAATLKAVME
ncbi:zinc ABC transporter substrate-binding protein [Candidatus Contubernalis alkalaceticus]|nr:zinc ABC transporter substrate-binding protein [Candidatus Contubernalis alkalaceticus]